MWNRIRQTRGHVYKRHRHRQTVFKIDDEVAAPNEGIVKMHDEPESPNEGAVFEKYDKAQSVSVTRNLWRGENT